MPMSRRYKMQSMVIYLDVLMAWKKMSPIGSCALIFDP